MKRMLADAGIGGAVKTAAASPADVVPPLLWFRDDREDGFSAWAEPNPAAHDEYCHTYWGSHGCWRPRGHDGDCWCDCCDCDDHARAHEEEGCVAGPPYYGRWRTRFYGDDAPRQPIVAVTRRISMWWHDLRCRYRWGSYRRTIPADG